MSYFKSLLRAARDVREDDVKNILLELERDLVVVERAVYDIGLKHGEHLARPFKEKLEELKKKAELKGLSP